MTEFERALNYIRIFVAAGDRWREFVPLDAVPTRRGIRFDTVEIRPHPDDPGVWLLDDGHTERRYAKVAT